MTKQFDKILVANRGEIAFRIMRTLRRMGIKTVAVYSESDSNALHVQYADEAIFIGPSAATDSYLSIPNILYAVRKSGAQAVHPGYGFLSENSAFARALASEAVTLIGPSSNAIKKMGDKIEAKKIAQQSGVSTVPGYMGIIKDTEQAITIASQIGFPVMVKAAAGGGGRGMRVVRSAAELGDAFRSASSEAKSSFSDGRVFIEKFIEHPRHIEIQLLADQFGNAVCLGERECSIQRHHQKVIEEAPSPFIDEETRAKMFAQVIALAKKVKYYSAGTVEFIVDQERNFYFLEMNTRLQVEHCVTELITGIDIVEQMVLIAAGEKLSFTQEEIKFNGWAIESRIYAEDPARGFLPSSGRIIQYDEPARSNNIRIDSGVSEGGEVSMFYDAMISKLCTHGETRADAIAYMQEALSNYVIRGISHNISFLEAIMAHPRFMSGDISTTFIEDEYPDGFLGAVLTSETSKIFLSVAMHIYISDAKRAAAVSGQLNGRNRQIGTRWVVNLDNTLFPVIIRPLASGYNIRYERHKISIKSNWVLGSAIFRGTVNHKAVSVKIEISAGGSYKLTYGGRTVTATVRTPRIAELEKFMPLKDNNQDSNQVSAPMGGRVVNIKAKVGDEIGIGQELLTIEAMKMENSICSEQKAKIAHIHVGQGDNVNFGQVLVEFE